MRPRSDYEIFESSSPQNRRLLRQEELILEVTEALVGVLVAEGIKRSELAARLGRSKGFISQILAGGRNLTLRTLADVADAMDCRVQVRVSHECPGSALPRTVERLEPTSWHTKTDYRGWSAKVLKVDFGRVKDSSGRAA